MSGVTYDEIEAARVERGQKPIGDIIGDQLADSATERRRRKKILRLHKKLRAALGDEHAIFLEIEPLNTERLIEVEKIAFEVGMAIGMQLGHRDPVLPPELGHVVEDLAAVCAAYPKTSVDAALACVLRSRLLAAGAVKMTSHGDDDPNGGRDD